MPAATESQPRSAGRAVPTLARPPAAARCWEPGAGKACGGTFSILPAWAAACAPAGGRAERSGAGRRRGGGRGRGPGALTGCCRQLGRAVQRAGFGGNRPGRDIPAATWGPGGGPAARRGGGGLPPGQRGRVLSAAYAFASHPEAGFGSRSPGARHRPGGFCRGGRCRCCPRAGGSSAGAAVCKEPLLAAEPSGVGRAAGGAAGQALPGCC